MKSKDTTDEGARLAQEFCCVIAQWKQMFSSSPHPEKVKVILDGIEDMEKSGFRRRKKKTFLHFLFILVFKSLQNKSAFGEKAVEWAVP